jgi:DNA-binding transcriptional regulator YiaG
MTPQELKAIRSSLGFTIRGFGKFIGKDKSTVFRWESGKVKIPLLIDRFMENLSRNKGLFSIDAEEFNNWRNK